MPKLLVCGPAEKLSQHTEQFTTAFTNAVLCSDRQEVLQETLTKHATELDTVALISREAPYTPCRAFHDITQKVSGDVRIVYVHAGLRSFAIDNDARQLRARILRRPRTAYLCERQMAAVPLSLREFLEQWDKGPVDLDTKARLIRDLAPQERTYMHFDAHRRGAWQLYDLLKSLQPRPT